jgi:integrase
MTPNCDTLSIFERAEMARRRGQRKGHLFEKSGCWMLRYRVDTPEMDVATGRPKRDRITVFVAYAKGPQAVGKREAQRIAWEEYLSKLDVMATRPSSMRTLREFIEQRFEPDVIVNCKRNGQLYYRTTLKHILPAIGHLPMREISAAHIQNLVNQKLAVGLTKTVEHIRTCMSAVLNHAKAMQWFAGELPTEAVRIGELPKKKQRRALTWEQVCAIAKLLPQPASTLVPFLALTGLRISEAMGLRWKWVNLTGEPKIVDAELIPPFCIAVREQFNRGRYQSTKTEASEGNIPIQEWFVPELVKLFAASKWQGPEDPVFASSVGTPMDEHNVAKRQLKQAAALAGLGTPAVPGAKGVKRKEAKSWVSWHCFRHTNATLADQLGVTVTERQKILRHATARMTMHYTHADLERMRERWKLPPEKQKLLM